MPDLEQLAVQMRLDALAVRASRALEAAGVPHVLLKGPTTARWLYDPPRAYRDVDILVPHFAWKSATDALHGAGVATASAGRLGEEASHAQVLKTPDGLELDLHVSLPLAPARTADGDERAWSLLTRHLTHTDLDGTSVPSLDVAGRCLVLALHALASDADVKAQQDLDLALHKASPNDWEQALDLAESLELAEEVRAALGLALGSNVRLPPHIALLRAGESEAFQLQRLAQLGPLQAGRTILHEVFPSRDFIRRYERSPDLAGGRLFQAYLRRSRRLVSRLPRAVKAVRRANKAPPAAD